MTEMSSYWPRPGGHVISINQGTAACPLRGAVRPPDRALQDSREAGHKVHSRPMIMQGRGGGGGGKGENDFLSRVNGRGGEQPPAH